MKIRRFDDSQKIRMGFYTALEAAQCLRKQLLSTAHFIWLKNYALHRTRLIKDFTSCFSSICAWSKNSFLL